jgi:hypothetical protein
MFRSFNLDGGKAADSAHSEPDPNDPNAGSGGGLPGRSRMSRSGLSPARGRLTLPVRSGRIGHSVNPRTGNRSSGGHSARRTAAHSDGFSAGPPGAQSGSPSVAEQLLRRLYEGSLALVSPTTGAGFGYGFGSVSTLGHHPHATGKPTTHPTPHQGHTRRGTIVAYNGGGNTATVRFGDTPDSPTLSVPVSPMIGAAVMAAATMAAVQLWDSTDPTDAMITAVL